MDRRIKYTKGVIKEALLELLNNKTLDKITVKEICQDADVNRATFYRHYKDIYDLFQQIEKDIIEEITLDSSRILDITKLLEFIYDLQGFYKEFFKRNLDSENIKNEIQKGYNKIVKFSASNDTYNPELFSYLFDYYVHGFNGLLRDWVNNGCVEPIDELYEVILHITKIQFGDSYTELL